MVKIWFEKPEPEVAPQFSNYWKIYFNSDILILRETKPGKGGEIQITDALLTQAKMVWF